MNILINIRNYLKLIQYNIKIYGKLIIILTLFITIFIFNGIRYATSEEHITEEHITEEHISKGKISLSTTKKITPNKIETILNIK